MEPEYDTNEYTYETKADSQRTDVWLRSGRAGGKDLEFGIGSCKLLHIG